MPGSSQAARIAKARAARIDVEDGTVAGKAQLDLASRPALHRDLFGHDRHGPPSGPGSGTRPGLRGSARRRRGLPGRVEKIVRPKAMVPLWPMEMPGSAGSPAPITLRPGRREVDDVAQRRRAVCAVRIVGEDGAASRGPDRRDSPVVAAKPSAALPHQRHRSARAAGGQSYRWIGGASVVRHTCVGDGARVGRPSGSGARVQAGSSAAAPDPPPGRRHRPAARSISLSTSLRAGRGCGCGRHPRAPRKPAGSSAARIPSAEGRGLLGIRPT